MNVVVVSHSCVYSLHNLYRHNQILNICEYSCRCPNTITEPDTFFLFPWYLIFLLKHQLSPNKNIMSNNFFSQIFYYVWDSKQTLLQENTHYMQKWAHLYLQFFPRKSYEMLRGETFLPTFQFNWHIYIRSIHVSANIFSLYPPCDSPCDHFLSYNIVLQRRTSQ